MLARAPETGQPTLASAAIFWNSSSLMPGTLAFRVRWLPVMPVPGLNVTSALVCTSSGVWPAWASAWLNAIEKQAEWAAAISSSGLVLPSAASVRAFQVTS